MQDHSSPRHISLRILFFVLLFACALPTHGQMDHLIHLTEEDGLPSNNVYGTLQDRTGALWFYTDNGIAKYKNKEFKIFSTENGLPSNDIWYLHQDTLGRIWTINSIDPTYYILNDSVCNYVIQENNLPLHPQNYAYLHDGIAWLNNKDKIKTIKALNYTTTPLDTFWIHSPYNNLPFILAIENEPQETRNLIKSNLKSAIESTHNDRITLFYYSKHIVILNYDKYTIKNFFNGTHTTTQIPSHKYNYNANTMNGAFINLNHKDGQLQFNLISEKSKELECHVTNINRIYKHNGTIAYCTEINGVFLKTTSIKPILNNGQMYDEICLSNNGSMLKRKNTILFYNKERRYIKEIPSSGDIIKFNDQCYYINKNTILFYNNNWIYETITTDFKSNGQKFNNRNAAYIFHSKPKVIILGKQKISLKKDKLLIHAIKNIDSYYNIYFTKDSISDICYFNNSILFSKKNAILSLCDSTHFDTLMKFSERLHITSLASFENKLLVNFSNRTLSIIDNGIIDTTFRINEDALIQETSGPYALLSGTNCLIIVDINKNTLKSFRKDVILPQSNLQDIDICGDSIFVLINNHIFSFNHTLINPPKYHIDLTCKYNHQNLPKSLSLRSSKENPAFSLALDHSADGGLGYVYYNYKLSPYQNSFLEATNPHLSYSNLPPGNYTFSAFAVDPFGNQSNTIQSSLRILPPFSQTWYFLCAIILGATSILSLIIFAILKNQQAKQNQKLLLIKQFSSLELEALRSQMNPHFVFNALSAIQHFIRLSDKEHADDYLSKFATLIRKFLDYSKQNTVLIKNELQLINSYIEIENLRFDNAIQYSLLISPDVDTYESIPSLLIQPFVENAINHGLFHSKKYPKVLSISIHQTDNLTHINISDNGIGRSASKILYHQTRQDHQSRGLSMQQERINTINSAGDFFVHLKIDNLNHLDHSGTVVQLSIENKLL